MTLWAFFKAYPDLTPSLFCSAIPATVTYQEFLEGFRKNTFAKAIDLEDAVYKSLHGHESFGSEDGELLGLDAKIPGGKYDSETMAQKQS